MATPVNSTPWQDKLIDYVISHSGALLSALVVIIIGLVAAGWIGKLIDRWLTHRAMEQPMRTLLVRVVKLFIFAMALVIALGTAGMDVTALIAGVSVAGVGVGLALQGVLGNLVAGLTIIFTKPFRVGEWIEIAGVSGQVTKIELFSTTLVHTDQSRVVSSQPENRRRNPAQLRQCPAARPFRRRGLWDESERCHGHRTPRAGRQPARAHGTRTRSRRDHAGRFLHQHRHPAVDKSRRLRFGPRGNQSGHCGTAPRGQHLHSVPAARSEDAEQRLAVITLRRAPWRGAFPREFSPGHSPVRPNPLPWFPSRC